VSVLNILTASRSRLNLFVNVLAHVLLPVSCNVSCLEDLNDVSCLVLSQPNLENLGSSRVLTHASWHMSLSQKKSRLHSFT